MNKKIYIKMKILIDGLFPMVNYQFENFIFKSAQYNETLIDVENEDYLFYSNGHLFHSCYGVVGKKGSFYNYFENNDYIELKTDEEIYNSREKLNSYVLENMSKKIKSIERRLRLTTNLDIGLPLSKIMIYDENRNYITYCGISDHQTSKLSILDYTEEMKELLNNRLKFTITEKTLCELERDNNRYNRAMTFYNNSFLINDTGVRFILLFSSIEALFNLEADDVVDNISKYVSKIMFESPRKTKKYYYKVKDFYDVRSKYIHGNEPRLITKKMEFDLREIVREVLLMYWYISQWENITEPQTIIEFLENNDRTTINLSIQLFKKSLYITDYKVFYQETRRRLLNGETNLLLK